jgi:hypothetical protein
MNTMDGRNEKAPDFFNLKSDVDVERTDRRSSLGSGQMCSHRLGPARPGRKSSTHYSLLL